MKKTLLTLSLCAFAFSANAADTATPSSSLSLKELSRRSEIEKTPSCKNVLDSCKKLGFVSGGFSGGNGLWKDCFYSTIQAKPLTLNNKEVKADVTAADVAACKAVVEKK